MAAFQIQLEKGKRIYFASDFHLGLASQSMQHERKRERKVIAWLDSIKRDAQTVFLMGDIFDFWFEYKHVAPKGFIRFLGAIAALTDSGISVHIFPGNHDLWMRDYLPKELGVRIHYEPLVVLSSGKKFYLAHGDGLGPGDKNYKLLKKVFLSPLSNWLFRWLHPDIGIGLARSWSKASRLGKAGEDEEYLGEKEFLTQYCQDVEAKEHHDYYVFGHRHLSLDIAIGSSAKYYNLGEWLEDCSYGVFDGGSFELKKFEYIASP
jgi:UDP-2,3-diacylglucosamine hydrolase